MCFISIFQASRRVPHGALWAAPGVAKLGLDGVWEVALGPVAEEPVDVLNGAAECVGVGDHRLCAL